MSNEDDALPIPALTTSPFTVKSVDSLEDIVSTVARILSTGQDHLALVTIRLGFAPDQQVIPHQSLVASASTHSFYQDLRPLVRKTDQVLLMGHSLYFLLPGATLQGGNIVQCRLWEALLWRVHQLTERALAHPRTVSIGHSSYPLPHTSFPALLAAADQTQFSFEVHSEKAPHSHTSAAHDQQGSEQGDQELPILARKLGIPYLTLLPSTFPQRLQRLVNPKLAQELQCYPLGRERNKLTVAMLNPDDHSALARLELETGLDIFPVLAHPHALQVALEQFV